MAGHALPFRVEPLHRDFGARIPDVDLAAPASDALVDAIREAFETWSVLLFPGQQLSPAAQVRFSERFGALERAITRQSAEGPGRYIAQLSNVGEDGALVPPDDRGQLFHAANRLWHTDSSFKPEPALASLLYAVEVPAAGGETEYASTRAGYASLPEPMRATVEARWAVHDFQRSRDLVAPGLVNRGVQQMLPPVSRPLVRRNPANGAPALYIASHAVAVEGMDEGESRRLLDALLDHCTRPECVYTHRWAPGDLVMWDNRCTLHRGRPFDGTRERRVMCRTTVIDRGYEAEIASRAA